MSTCINHSLGIKICSQNQIKFLFLANLDTIFRLSYKLAWGILCCAHMPALYEGVIHIHVIIINTFCVLLSHGVLLTWNVWGLILCSMVLEGEIFIILGTMLTVTSCAKHRIIKKLDIKTTKSSNLKLCKYSAVIERHCAINMSMDVQELDESESVVWH